MTLSKTLVRYGKIHEKMTGRQPVTYSTTTLIKGPSQGNPNQIADWAIGLGAFRPTEVRSYLNTLYDLCQKHGLRFELLVAQSMLETGNSSGTIPWASSWWQNRLNPAGIGITGDAVQNNMSRTFKTGVESAKAHFLHVWLYSQGATIPEGLKKEDDPRWDAAQKYAGMAPSLQHFTNTWAIDEAYDNKILGRLARLQSAGLIGDSPVDVPQEQEPPMALKAYTVPGLSKPLHLPDDIRVEIKLIANSNWGGTASSTQQTKTTWHDTGPTGGNADGEWSWANNGRQGAGPAGYQAIIDDDQIIICHPFNKVTWHAGTNLGNVTSYGAEQCREGVDRNRAIRNAAAFHGAVCAAKGWEVDTALVQHHYWYGKNCPSYIRATGQWSNAVRMTAEFARAAAGGTGGGGAPTTYAKPVVIPELDAVSQSEGLAPPVLTAGGTDWFWVGDRVKAKVDTPRYQRASTSSAHVGPLLKAGEEFDVDWITLFEGERWYYTPWGTRVLVKDTERVSDVKGDERDAEGG